MRLEVITLFFQSEIRCEIETLSNFSLTDMAGYKDNLEARIVASNWMSAYSGLQKVLCYT